MNTGQMNIASLQSVTQLVTQEQAVPVFGTMAGVQQNSGNFAGLLNGIQFLAKVKVPSSTGQAEQPHIGMVGKGQSAPNAAVEEPTVVQPALLHASSHIGTASDNEAAKQEDSKKTDVFANVVPQSDVPSQMALAAYLLAGRMPDVNIPTSLPVDMPQKAAAVTEQSAVITAPAVTSPSEQDAAEPVLAPSLQSVATPAAGNVAQAVEEQNQHNHAETARPAAVDMQTVTTVAVAPAVSGAVKAGPSAENINVLQRASVEESVPAFPPQSVQSDRMSEVNKTMPLSVDKSQNAVGGTERSTQTEIVAAPSVKIPSELDTAEPVPALSLKPVITQATAVEVVPASLDAGKARPHAENIAMVQRATVEAFIPASSSQPVQSDNKPEVNIMTPPSAAMLRKESTVEGQAAVIAVPPVRIPSELGTEEPIPAPSVEPAVTPAAEPVAQQNQNLQPETVRSATVDMQPATTVAAAPASPGAIKAGPDTENIIVGQRTSVEELVSASALQPVQSGRMPEAGKKTPLSVDTLQNAAAVTEQPAVITAPAVTLPPEHGTVEPLQAPLAKLSVTPATEPVVQPAAEQNQHHPSETLRPVAVDVQPATAAVEAAPASPDAVTEKPHAENITVAQRASVDETVVVASLRQPVQSDNNTPQKEARATEQSAVIAAPSITLRSEHGTVEPLQAPSAKPAVTLSTGSVAQPAAEQNQHHQPETVRPEVVDMQPFTAANVAPATAGVIKAGADAENISKVQRASVDMQPDTVVNVPPVTAGAVKTGAYAENITMVQRASVEKSVPASLPQPVQDSMSKVNIPTQLPVDTAQNVAGETEQPADIAASVVKPSSEQGVTESALQRTVQPVQSDSTSKVNIPTPLPVDNQKNEVNVIDQASLISASPDKIQVEQTTAVTVQTVPTEKSAAPSVSLKSELPSAHQTASAPALPPASELEISLSQPRPITARVTPAPVLADNRSAALVQEIRGGVRQRVKPEQQIEKIQSSDEPNAVKETASLLQTASSGGLPGDSDTSRRNDSNQGQSDAGSDNLMSAQQMRGQLGVEHQKVAAIATKAVPTEAARQDIPEQIMQQVKERLVQHDVKPGNQQITLTLSPDSLGELKMNLNLQGQKLSVEIVTENRTVRDAIVQHTDALKESLARQNITMESFDVTTGGKGSGNQGQNQNAWREMAKQQQQQQLWTSGGWNRTSQADMSHGQLAYQKKTEHTMLDIHY